MQAGTTLKLVVRSHLSLTDTLARQQTKVPKPFSRAVFLFDYADSELLHSIEKCFRGVNARNLDLHKSPGSMAARARAASAAGSRPADTGLATFSSTA